MYGSLAIVYFVLLLYIVICLCASQLGAGTHWTVLEQFSLFQGVGDMLSAAEQSLPEWKQFINF